LGRPWGFMLMPQATGVVIGALVLFFLAQDRPLRFWWLLGIGIAAIYITGSKTSYIVVSFAICLLLIYRHKAYAKVFIGVSALCISFIVLKFLLTFEDPDLVFWRFSHSLFNFFYYIFMEDVIDDQISSYHIMRNSPNIIDLIFGQGVLSPNNILAGQGEIHILNSILHIGILPSLFWLLAIAMFLIRTASHVALFEPKGGFYLGAFFFLFVIGLGSFHYMVAARFPISAIMMLIISLASRNLFSRPTQVAQVPR
jgi:hypothetical protein